MKGIIYIAHGSKVPDKNKLFREFVDEIIKHRTEKVQRLAFLEKDDENVPIVAQQMIDAGVTEFIVMPMLLFPAMHAVEDIPAQMAEVLKDYPHITYRQADCFGDEPSVYNVALERLNEIEGDLYLITAHGNKRFPEPDTRLTEMVQVMQSETEKPLMSAMLYGELNFRRIIKSIDINKRIVIMPYFLFDGHLVRKIKRLSVPLIEEGYDIKFTETLDLNFSMVNAVLKKLEALDEAIVCIR